MGYVKDWILDAIERGAKLGRTDNIPVYLNTADNRELLGTDALLEYCSGNIKAQYIIHFEDTGWFLFTDDGAHPSSKGDPMAGKTVGELLGFGVLTFPDSSYYEFWEQVSPHGETIAGEIRPRGYYFRFVGKPEGPIHWVTPGDPNEYAALAIGVEGPFLTYQALMETIHKVHGEGK